VSTRLNSNGEACVAIVFHQPIYIGLLKWLPAGELYKITSILAYTLIYLCTQYREATVPTINGILRIAVRTP
jgi:hypothetical protein